MQRKTTDTAGLGHNSLDRDKLKELVSRIESAEDEKVAIAEDLRGLYAEARSAGFDAAALRQVIKLRRQDKDKRDAKQAIVDAYLHALPGRDAIRRPCRFPRQRLADAASLTAKGGIPWQRQIWPLTRHPWTSSGYPNSTVLERHDASDW
jgi:uncharacterized protein (UPF0335 family)